MTDRVTSLVNDVTSGANELVEDITDGIGNSIKNTLSSVDEGLNTFDTNVKT